MPNKRKKLKICKKEKKLRIKERLTRESRSKDAKAYLKG
jgi:hypothetical protein